MSDSREATPLPPGRLHTFVFADLAGYTALTEAHGDAQAADLVGEFCAVVRRLVGAHGAEEVKTIGDAVMIRANHPADAVRLGLELVEVVGRQHGFPSVRVGIHTGLAVERDRDWFGTAVNVAARVSAAAGGGEVLMTAATLEVADELAEIELSERGRRQLRNVAAPVLLYAAARAGERTPEKLPVDPVCRMAVDPMRSAGKLHHGGREYHFCSITCARAFTAAPESHVGPSAKATITYHDAAAILQGSSYLGFGLWSLLARGHYRRRHRLQSSAWLLNAHGMWLTAVGGVLAAAGYRRRGTRAELRTLGLATAVGLAIDDAVSAATEGVAPVHYADLAWELGLATLWAASYRGRLPGAGSARG